MRSVRLFTWSAGSPHLHSVCSGRRQARCTASRQSPESFRIRLRIPCQSFPTHPSVRPTLAGWLLCMAAGIAAARAPSAHVFRTLRPKQTIPLLPVDANSSRTPNAGTDTFKPPVQSRLSSYSSTGTDVAPWLARLRRKPYSTISLRRAAAVSELTGVKYTSLKVYDLLLPGRIGMISRCQW